MFAEKNKVVSVKYTLLTPHKITDEETIVEKTDDSNPLVWLFDSGMMIPDFEKNIKGKKAGDTFDFRIKAADGYGEYNPEYVVSIPMDAFKDKDGKVNNDILKVGNTIPMQDDRGNHLQGTVLEVSLPNVKMDFNHPMAGKDLHFLGEVVSVREATNDEISHGHVHGPGGHHH